MAGNWYNDLDDLQARYAMTFSDYEWTPTAAQIYQATADCLCARAKSMVDEYAGVSFTIGGGSSTPANIKEASCQIVMRLIMERGAILGLHGVTSLADEWGSMAVQQGEYEIMTPEIRMLIDKDRAEAAFPLRVTVG